MAKYKKEYYGYETLEDENGFITFVLQGDMCYLEDIYVVEEKRQQGIGKKYADVISKVAKEKGCKYLTTTVNMAGLTPDRSMKAILAYGFKPTGFINNCVTFRKEL